MEGIILLQHSKGEIFQLYSNYILSLSNDLIEASTSELGQWILTKSHTVVGHHQYVCMER